MAAIFTSENLGVIPIVDGSEKILKITPSGQVKVVTTGFTTILGLALDHKHRLYVLEDTTGGHPFPTPGTGTVLRINHSGIMDEIASGLSLPTGMTFGPDGDLYISNWGFGSPNLGEIVRITLPGDDESDDRSRRLADPNRVVLGLASF